MNERYRITLLIPYLDGEYYGSLFSTLQQEAQRRASTLFTIQALASTENPSAFDLQIGTEMMDGWLLMTDPQTDLPASHRFLEALQATGKPIVTIGYEEHAIRCHSVVIDNRQAIREAVIHLVRDHGHRRIAFVGCTKHADLLERFEGYKAALHECGIAYDDSLYFPVADALRNGGAAAAERMLEQKTDCTAVIAATDLNAMGLIDRLHQAGYRIPEDLAVIGFDDLSIAATFDPPLTTIHHPIQRLGLESFELLYRLLKGETIRHSTTYIPTEFIPRSSCGCPYSSNESPLEVMRDKLLQSEKTVDWLIESHNQLAANWASAAREDFFDLSKMFEGICHWGCLFMWEKGKDGRQWLVVKQAFSTKGEPTPPYGESVPIEQFPPVRWLPEIGEDEFVRVQMIGSDRQDLGFIVLIGPVDRLVLVSEVDVTRISCNISVTALERDQWFHEVRSIAEQLEIVSRTTNDGIWDLDLSANRIQWSSRTHDMIRSIGEQLTSDPESFLRLIDPEHYPHVMEALNRHLQDDSPFQIEFRIRGREQEQQLWLYAAGDSIRDQNGSKIRMIGSLTNITEKKLAEEQIIHLAFHDVLTGLPNRALLKERFQQSKEEANRAGRKLGMMLVDLDRFKSINDTLGHLAGDQLLKTVARMLERIVADTGVVARLGGDEFIVLLTEMTEVSELEQIADTILQSLRSPFMIEDQEIYTSVSIGMCLYPDDAQDLVSLTRAADMALYKAKASGKNRAERFRQDIQDIHSFAPGRLTVEQYLREALDQGQFELHYQPQMDLSHHRLCGVEAIIRWNCPERGLIPSAEFIPVAEEIGLAVPIGRWMLQEACRQQKQWIDLGLEPIPVAVNISSVQLQQNSFVKEIEETLADTGLPPAALCLELTENAVSSGSDCTRHLQHISDLGVRLTIDEFGDGCSSLSMLKRLPLAQVKLASSIVRSMTDNPEDAIIASAVIGLARNLGMSVIADGVDRDAQVQFLKRENCDAIQGNLVSEPLTPELFLEYIHKISRTRHD